MKINGLILAAGSSNRLKQPKQLVMFQGKSLLQHTEMNISPWVSQLYVVLGYQHEKLQSELKNATSVINKQWHLGMGTSLSCGIKTAAQSADAVLIALCDQPKIPASHYQELALCAKQNTTKIITTSYANTQGVPVIFPQCYFAELLSLKAEQGAQALLHQYSQNTLAVNCEAAASDIDSPHDLKIL